MSPDEAGQLPLDLDVEYSERQRRAFAGRDPWDEAVKWREANPEGYDLVVRWAFADAGAGRRCSMKYYGELLRKPWQRTTAVLLSLRRQQHDAVGAREDPAARVP